MAKQFRVEEFPDNADWMLDGRKVRLSYANHGGYCKWEASRGDVICYKHLGDSPPETGIVIARAVCQRGRSGAYNYGDIRLCVLVFDDTNTHVYARIVHPDDVQECRDGNKAWPAWMDDSEFWSLSPAQMVRLQKYGTLNRDAFGHWRESHERIEAGLAWSKAQFEIERLQRKVSGHIREGQGFDAGFEAKMLVRETRKKYLAVWNRYAETLNSAGVGVVEPWWP